MLAAVSAASTGAREAARPKRAAALPADERRSMIIAATLPLLLEHGEMVTTHHIADAAGIAEGTIFRVFASKEALIEAVIDHALDVGSVERAIAGIDAGLPLEEAVAQVVALAVASEALVALFEAHRRELTVEPAEAARIVRSVTLAMTHPMMVSEAVAAAEVARRFLYGVARGPAC
jgi:AcrR family transcriptional regulator